MSEPTVVDPAAGSTPQTHDKGNLEARLRSEPDFAVAEHKKAQRYIAELQQKTAESDKRLKSLDQIAKAAELVGNGNLETGASQLVTLADRGYRIENDPKMKQWYDKYVSGGAVPETQNSDTDEYLTPEQKEVRELRQTVETLRGQVGQNQGRQAVLEMQGHIESFFEADELGKAIDGSLRGEMFKAMCQQIDTWSKTPDGRRQMATFDSESIRLIALNHLTKSGKLYEVAERARAIKEGVMPMGADVPRISGMATEEIPDFSGPHAARRALEFASKKYGVKL